MKDEAAQDTVSIALRLSELTSTLRAAALSRLEPKLRQKVETLWKDRVNEQANDPWIGKTVADFKICERLGEGGMGTAYKGIKESPVKLVRAIKLVRSDILARDFETPLRQITHEAQLLSRLNHDGIVRLTDVVQAEQQIALIMDYVDRGIAITEYCDRETLTVDQRLALFDNMCSGMAAAHDHEIVHRDLKPSNILIDREGHPKILDFGVAEHLDPLSDNKDGKLDAYTPEYASPEQVEGLNTDHRSDIYSLGVVLYEVLTGRRPYQINRRDQADIRRKVCEVTPCPPSKVVLESYHLLSHIGQLICVQQADIFVEPRRCRAPADLAKRLERGLDDIVVRALGKRPGMRFQSIKEFQDALRKQAHPTPATKPRPKRHQLLKIVGVGIAVGAIGIPIWKYQKSPGQTPNHTSRSQEHVDSESTLGERSIDQSDPTPKPSAAIQVSIEQLWTAVTSGDESTVRAGLNQYKVNTIHNTDGQTLLHKAAFEGQVGIVKILLDAGAVVDAVQDGKIRPLHIACQRGHTATARLLLEQGANCERPSNAGYAPIHLAAAGGHVETIELLANEEYACDLQQPSVSRLFTPLHRAAVFFKPETAKVLLELGAQVDPRTHDNQTPLLAALEAYGLEKKNKAQFRSQIHRLATLLRKHGADLSATSKNGETAEQLLRNYGLLNPEED